MNRRVWIVFFFLCCFGLVVASNERAGAFSAEFAGDPDEPAHYVTGLLVRDYVAAGFPGNPLQYARDYYLHYPKVGLGHWPPGFYLVQAAWTLVFTPSRVSLMLLMAALTAITATLLGTLVGREFNATYGVAAGLLFLSLPVVARYSQSVMAEMLLTLLVTLAVLAYGRYLDCERWVTALWFAIWATLAVLTKGTGLVLALVPILSVIQTRRWRLLGRFSFWLPALIVLAIAGPWYLWVPGAQHEAVARFGGLNLIIGPRVLGSFTTWVEMLGVLPALAALAGLFVVGTQILTRQASGKWVAGVAVLASAYGLRLFVGAWEDRHLLAEIPVLLLFASAGISSILAKPLFSQISKLSGVTAGLAVAALILLNVQNAPVKRHYGYSQAARALLEDPQFRSSIFLVCSGTSGEGAFISEIAMHERRPSHVVLRGSKMLAATDWMSYKYRSLFDSPSKAIESVEALSTRVVLIDSEGRVTRHGQLLQEGLRQHSDQWTLIAHYGDANDILVYSRKGGEARSPGKIHLPERGLFANPN